MKADFLSGGGEMGALMRLHDWSATPLGQPEQWPQSLKTAVSIILNSKYPMFLAWGPELGFLYNDGYRPVFGAKHPRVLGRPFAEIWSEIWLEIQPLVDRAMAGEATWSEDLPLAMHRSGYLEEVYFTFSYSPIRDETGGVGGMFCACTETTDKVLGERRLLALSNLSARLQEARSGQEACTQAAQILEENGADVPFALIYLLDETDSEARLVASANLGPEDAAASHSIDLTADPETVTWPLRVAADANEAVVLRNVGSRLGPPPRGPRLEPAADAIVVPFGAPGQAGPAGFLVAGVNPRRALDEKYRSFFQLAAGHVATAVGNARAYEEARKRAEALAELDRAKTAFFSNVSHEFRTPLTLLLGPIEDALADQNRVLTFEDAARLELAHRNGLRLLRLVNTLLDFSRIEAGRTQAIYEPIDLATYTAELASVFRAAVEKAGMRLTIECPPLPHPVFVDRDMWEKIVLNLVSNAFKYTFEGEIRVSLRADQGSVVLTVQDTGTGISEAELPNLFNRFHRIAGARGRTQEGTGIGLALVSELAKLHGGTVAVRSALGTGSSFAVTVPFGKQHLPADQIGGTRAVGSTALRASAFVEEALRWLPGAAVTDQDGFPGRADSPLQAPPASTGGGARSRIVLADDNADMREYVRRLLARDYEVIAVTDGGEALRAILEHGPDLVLTDVMMPNLDGVGLLQAIRADSRTASIPVVMLSARAGEEARVEGLHAGADDYLIKPFTARELLARVGGTLAVARIRREAVEALRESEARFRNMADNAPVMIWVTDALGASTYLNRRWYEFTGQSPETGLGLGWIQAVHPDDRSTTEDTFLAANEKRQGFRLDYRLRRNDGAYRWAIDSAAPRFATDGQFLGYIGSVIDITERREAEERLRQSAKMEAVGRLAGGLAHDFNNQLHAVLGFAEFVARDTGLSAQARHDLSEIQKVAERMASLTHQLLAYSRQQILMPETLDLNDALRDSQAMLQRLIGSDIQMSLRLSPEAAWVQVDRSQLLQVLLNLAINARDAMAQGGELILETSIQRVESEELKSVAGAPVEPGHYAKLVVMDSGTGIAPEHLPHLFEPFFTTKEVGKGTGLGLATVQGIVMQSHGYVWGENAASGGASFSVLIPLSGEPKIAPSPSPPGGAATLRHARVLVVEDEDMVRRLAARALEAQGYEVLHARHGGEALDHLEAVNGAVDLLLSDVVMPVMGGRELGERLAAEYPDIPVVWMSGYTRDAAFGSAAPREGQPFLQKPVPGDVLVDTVRQVLEGRMGSASCP